MHLTFKPGECVTHLKTEEIEAFLPAMLRISGTLGLLEKLEQIWSNGYFSGTLLFLVFLLFFSFKEENEPSLF